MRSRIHLRRGTAKLACLLATATAWGQATDRPAPRFAHTLVYDEQLQRVVLIGGHHTGSAPTDDPLDIWTFDGAKWERLKPSASTPVSRFLASAAFDRSRHQLVLFGGQAGKTASVSDETWIWDHRNSAAGSPWRKAEEHVGTAGLQLRRQHQSMTYDEQRRRIVMYGGTSSTPPSTAAPWPDHVSEWDGFRWHTIPAKASNAPGARNGTAIVYDAKRKQVVLFGGVGQDRSYRSGTWIWNGKEWRQTGSGSTSHDPPLRATHQMAYDHRAGVVLLYGGGFTDGVRSVKRADMWQWDGKRWKEISPSSSSTATANGAPTTPGPRVGHAMAYDRARGRLVLFGGFGEGPVPLGDTWEWDGARWKEVK